MTFADTTAQTTFQLTYGVLVGVLPPTLTPAVLARTRRDMLEAMAKPSVHGAIFDASAVDVMDAEDYRNLCDTARMCGMMGRRPAVICGLRPSVVAALVDLGIDAEVLSFRRNVEASLQWLRGQGA